MNVKTVFQSLHEKCETRAFYLNNFQRSIFVWQHNPISKIVNNKAVIICPAIGYEYNHTYRSLRRLADYLCAQGFIVFRFDYFGTGNSSGSILSDESMDYWVDDIQALSDAVVDILPGFKQCLLGLRLGGTLATLAAKSPVIDSLVLWEPIVKGRPYIRELEAISRLAISEGTNTEDYLETAGFVLSKNTAEKIKKINLTKDIQASPGRKILQLVRDDKQTNNSFLTQLRERGIDIHVHLVEGYQDMMAEPHYTKTPVEAIEYISQWLEQRSEKIKQTVPALLPGEPTLKLNQGDALIQEQPFFFGSDQSLFGILTKPVNDNDKSSHCIILANSGAVHHAGPNSIYTLISRTLGALGYYVFRIDLENLGDSHIVNPEVENHPYQPNAVENIRSAIEFIQQRASVDNFILGGLCSGAHTVFHSSLVLSDMNISKVIMINPLTFYWEPSMSLETPNALRVFLDHSYYKQSLYSLQKWKKVFAGKADIGYICRFVFNRFAELAKDIWRDSISLIMGERTPLALDLLKIDNNGTEIRFIFASTDPGLDIINSQAKRTLKKGINENWIGIHIIEDADHTFTKKSSREDLLSILSKDFENL